jgi:hypothetical protein
MWIEHDGSEWPKHASPDELVRVRFKDGSVTTVYRPVRWWHGDDVALGSNWYWDHSAVTISSEIAEYLVKSE